VFQITVRHVLLINYTPTPLRVKEGVLYSTSRNHSDSDVPRSANVRGLFFSWFRIEIEIKRERGKGLGVLFYWGWGGGCLSSAFAMVAITSLHHWAKRQIRPRPTVYPPFFNFPFLPPLTGGYSPKKKTGG